MKQAHITFNKDRKGEYNQSYIQKGTINKLMVMKQLKPSLVIKVSCLKWEYDKLEWQYLYSVYAPNLSDTRRAKNRMNA